MTFGRTKFILSVALMAAAFFSKNTLLADEFHSSLLSHQQEVFLGATFLNFDRDADAIRVPHICGVTNIQMTVRGNDAQVDYLMVRFGNGSVQQLNLRDYFREGSSSRAIDLNGEGRCIDEIFVQGRTRTNGRQAQLLFTGFTLMQPIDNPVLLGSTSLEFNRDADIIRVPHICGITNIQMTVRGNDAQVDYLVIRYGNSEVEQLNLRDYFREGSSSRLINLNGGRRCIEEIFVQGRTRTNGNRAHLVFKGFSL